MKKFIALLTVLAVFTGCSLSETFKDDPEFTAMIGVLSTQKENDEYVGTHILTVGGEDVIPIRSLSINLDSREYLGNKVEALGVMNSTDQVFEVTGITVIEVLDSATSDNELQEYENFELGFRLNYYSDWEVEEKISEVNFLAPLAPGQTARTFVKIAQEPYAYSPTTGEDGGTDSPLLAYFMEKEGRDVSGNINKVGVDLIDGVKTELSGSEQYTLYRPGLIYRISYFPAEGAGTDLANAFKDMISSFQFVGFEPDGEAVEENSESASQDTEEVVSTVDMEFTTFESLPYSFAGKYPKSWYYAGKKGGSAGVLHHYGFSDESVNDTNELITLDILSSPSPGGDKKIIDGKEFYIQTSGEVYTVSFTLKEQNYRFKGNVSHKDLILTMAKGITPVEVAGF